METITSNDSLLSDEIDLFMPGAWIDSVCTPLRGSPARVVTVEFQQAAQPNEESPSVSDSPLPEPQPGQDSLPANEPQTEPEEPPLPSDSSPEQQPDSEAALVAPDSLRGPQPEKSSLASAPPPEPEQEPEPSLVEQVMYLADMASSTYYPALQDMFSRFMAENLPDSRLLDHAETEVN